ncbi:glutathione S-transferase omega-1-like isoform X2 [Epargyreus clarus]
MRYCPFAQRTILVLNAKQIDYEVVNIDLKNKPEWLKSKSPLGKVPSIEVKEGVCIYESLITAEYLDEAYPQRPLLPKDPVAKAFDKIIVEVSAPIYTMFMKIFYKPETITPEIISAYHGALDNIQDELKKRGTKFLGGSEPGYADYMIWPWFERLRECEKIEDKCAIDPKQYKLLVEYINNMLEDPAVSQYLVPSQAFFNLLDSYREGKSVNYDELLTA